LAPAAAAVRLIGGNDQNAASCRWKVSHLLCSGPTPSA